MTPMNGTMSGAKIDACRCGAMMPNRDGPSRIPASTSPITRGWPMRGMSVPSSRANSITITIAMKNATTCWSAVRVLVATRFSAAADGGLPGSGASVTPIVSPAALPTQRATTTVALARHDSGQVPALVHERSRAACSRS